MAEKQAAKIWFNLIVTMVLIGVIGTAVWTIAHRENKKQVYGPPSSWDTATIKAVHETHQIAEEYFQHKQFDAAHQILADHLKKFPQDAKGYGILSRVVFAQGYVKKAYELAQQSLELDGQQVDVLAFAATLATKFGDMDKAIGYYHLAEQIDRANPRYPLSLANLYLRKNDLNQAQLWALRTLRLAPSTHVAYFILSQVRANRGNTVGAIEQIDKALALCKPHLSQYLTYVLRKAELQRRINQPEMALATIEALGSDRQIDRQVVEAKAMCYLMLSQPAKAAAAWAALYDMAPADVDAAAEAGLCYQKAGDLEKARQYLIIAGGISPDYPKVKALQEAIKQSVPQRKKP